jgi:hypothetical protein
MQIVQSGLLVAIGSPGRQDRRSGTSVVHAARARGTGLRSLTLQRAGPGNWSASSGLLNAPRAAPSPDGRAGPRSTVRCPRLLHRKCERGTHIANCAKRLGVRRLAAAFEGGSKLPQSKARLRRAHRLAGGKPGTTILSREEALAEIRRQRNAGRTPSRCMGDS